MKVQITHEVDLKELIVKSYRQGGADTLSELANAFKTFFVLETLDKFSDEMSDAEKELCRLIRHAEKTINEVVYAHTVVHNPNVLYTAKRKGVSSDV